MRLLIFGSRDINTDLAQQILEEQLDRLQPSHIVTAGEPEGVCAVARRLAQERSIPLVLHFKHRKRLAGQYHHRSIAALKDCDQAIFIHNGSSQGTTNEIALAVKMKIEHQVILTDKAANGYGWTVDDKEFQ